MLRDEGWSWADATPPVDVDAVGAAASLDVAQALPPAPDDREPCGGCLATVAGVLPPGAEKVRRGDEEGSEGGCMCRGVRMADQRVCGSPSWHNERRGGHWLHGNCILAPANMPCGSTLSPQVFAQLRMARLSQRPPRTHAPAGTPWQLIRAVLCAGLRETRRLVYARYEGADVDGTGEAGAEEAVAASLGRLRWGREPGEEWMIG